MHAAFASILLLLLACTEASWAIEYPSISTRALGARRSLKRDHNVARSISPLSVKGNDDPHVRRAGPLFRRDWKIAEGTEPNSNPTKRAQPQPGADNGTPTDAAKVPSKKGSTGTGSTKGDKKGGKSGKKGGNGGGEIKDPDITEYCEIVADAEYELHSLIPFRHKPFDGLSAEALLDKWADICFTYQEKKYPLYDDNDKAERFPQIDPETGKGYKKHERMAIIARVPGHADIYSATCTIFDVTNILYYTAKNPTYNDLNSWTKQVVLPDGKLTLDVLMSIQALDASDVGQPCKNVKLPPP